MRNLKNHRLHLLRNPITKPFYFVLLLLSFSGANALASQPSFEPLDSIEINTADSVMVNDIVDEITSSVHLGSQITISGKLFYNDLRKTGRQDLKRDTLGNVGTRVPFDGSMSQNNFLGAHKVVADFFEIDTDTVSAGCTSMDYLGAFTIHNDGHFEFSLPAGTIDSCATEANDPLKIGIRFRLRLCNDLRCMSVVNPQNGNSTYMLWSSQASLNNPLEVTSGDYVLQNGVFRTAYGDDYSLAANHYASLAEAAQFWFVDNGVPYDPTGSDGEIFVNFPSLTASAAQTRGRSNIDFPYPASGWPGGGYHEFGHIINNRAWPYNADFLCGDCPGGKYMRDGVDGWNIRSREYSYAGAIEGWGIFVNRAVLTGTSGDCSDSFDDNATTYIYSGNPNEQPNASPLVSKPWDGKAFARNVTKLLCDWLDDGPHNDDDPNMAGTGDHFTATPYSIWYNLRESGIRYESNHYADYLSTGTSPGIDMCEYIDYYLNERKSVANVGQAAHDSYVASITDLAYNNGMKCGLARP